MDMLIKSDGGNLRTTYMCMKSPQCSQSYTVICQLYLNKGETLKKNLLWKNG